MIRNYLTVAVRNLVRERLYTTINVVGLSIAVATCILFGVGLHYKLSMDRFYEPSTIYRVVAEETPPNGVAYLTSMQRHDLAEQLSAAIPEIESTVPPH